jgi:predicted HTH transcriptional regulator
MDDKRNLAKCLSGFANSSGGIIVWGVDARKNAQGIDCASAASEIASIRQFLSRLNELTGEAV